MIFIFYKLYLYLIGKNCIICIVSLLVEIYPLNSEVFWRRFFKNNVFMRSILSLWYMKVKIIGWYRKLRAGLEMWDALKWGIRDRGGILLNLQSNILSNSELVCCSNNLLSHQIIMRPQSHFFQMFLLNWVAKFLEMRCNLSPIRFYLIVCCLLDFLAIILPSYYRN